MPRWIGFYLVLVMALALNACDRPKAKVTPQRKLSVVATVYPLADVARQIGGDLVEVTWVIEAGQSLSGVQPDPVLRNRLRGADVLLMGGATEGWAAEASGGGEQYDRILRLQALPVAREVTEPGYLWLDPLIVRAAAEDLSYRLQVLRPEATAAIKARTEQFVAKLNSIHESYQSRLLAAQTRRMLVLNTDFMPFLRRFSFSGIPTLDVPPSRLTDENIRVLQFVSRQQNTRLLVLPADTPAAVVDDLRVRSQLQIILLDALGSSAAGGRNTYPELMEWNLEQLARATIIQ